MLGPVTGGFGAGIGVGITGAGAGAGVGIGSGAGPGAGIGNGVVAMPPGSLPAGIGAIGSGSPPPAGGRGGKKALVSGAEPSGGSTGGGGASSVAGLWGLQPTHSTPPKTTACRPRKIITNTGRLVFFCPAFSKEDPDEGVFVVLITLFRFSIRSKMFCRCRYPLWDLTIKEHHMLYRKGLQQLL